MNISILTVSRKTPDWIEQGYREYSSRMPREFPVKLLEVNPAKRHKSSKRSQITAEEGERLLAAVPKSAYVVALDERGEIWDTAQLAGKLSDWQADYNNIAFLIGGADGLSEQCRQRADAIWSLSKLTFPHEMVRVLLAEQLYRAWTVTVGHPYHRQD
jgi:23S rRNA (pseudouridine1915-N3)-methyltransferase